jgi:hypothetical protein
MSRCVRRSSFRDRTAGGLDLDHRQEWIAQRLRAIAEFFTIDVTDFGVIDNEFHAVLRNRPDLAAKLTDEQVIRRWFRMSRRNLALQPEIGKKQLKEWLSKRKKLAEFRRRLSSISWLMIMLKEPIARAANAEDGVRGHFFGERFSSVELEGGEQRLVTSLQINSLPVRAGLAKDLATSRFTAAHARRNGDGNWLAGELPADDSHRSTSSSTAGSPWAASPTAGAPAADCESADCAASDCESSADADSEADDASSDVSSDAPSDASSDASSDAPSDASSVVSSEEATDASSEEAGADTATSAGRADAATCSPLFNRLPLDVYLDWLEAHVSPAGPNASLKTAAMEIPVALPSAWLRYGLDVAKWSEAVELIAPRFRWLAEVAASMRRDSRRFVADESPSTR